jgi:hypothetical protein
MKTLLLVLGFSLISAALAQQSQQSPIQAPTGAQSETKKGGAIEGHVLNSKTGEPIRRVNLTLRPFNTTGTSSAVMVMGPMAPAAPYAGTSDAEGKFRIENIEPGSYRLAAERQGFVLREYGSGQNSMMGTTIKVVAASELKDLNFKLIPQALITGRVIDNEAEGLAHVQIQILRRRFIRGKQQLMPMGGGQTTDTGEFRISDLAPGRYWVSATYRGRMMMFGEAPARNTGDKPEEEYVPTYYPNSTDQAAARSIDLDAGQEMPGVDIRIQKVRVYRIRGKVTGGAQPLRNVRLAMIPREREVFMGMLGGGGGMVKEDGSFEIGGVQPGSYYVTALPMQGIMNPMGKVAVDVRQENVENVTLALASGVTIRGGIGVDGDLQQLEQAQGKKISFETVRVQLIPIDGIPFGVPSVSAKDDGSFALENAGPDRYRIGVFSLPQGLWLKSIRAGEREVIDSGIDLGGGTVSPLQITLGVGTGSVSGVVLDAKQQPATGSMVTLVPDPFKEERNDLFRLVSADQTGRFDLQGIPPGEYKLFAWADIEPGSYMDPEFLKPQESKATKITVKAKSQQQVSLTQIPADSTATR